MVDKIERSEEAWLAENAAAIELERDRLRAEITSEKLKKVQPDGRENGRPDVDLSRLWEGTP